MLWRLEIVNEKFRWLSWRCYESGPRNLFPRQSAWNSRFPWPWSVDSLLSVLCASAPCFRPLSWNTVLGRISVVVCAPGIKRSYSPPLRLLQWPTRGFAGTGPRCVWHYDFVQWPKGKHLLSFGFTIMFLFFNVYSSLRDRVRAREGQREGDAESEAGSGLSAQSLTRGSNS